MGNMTYSQLVIFRDIKNVPDELWLQWMVHKAREITALTDMESDVDKPAGVCALSIVTTDILLQINEKYKSHHGLSCADEALEAANTAKLWTEEAK